MSTEPHVHPLDHEWRAELISLCADAMAGTATPAALARLREVVDLVVPPWDRARFLDSLRERADEP